MDAASVQVNGTPEWHSTFEFKVFNQTLQGFSLNATRTDIIPTGGGWQQNLLVWWQAKSNIDMQSVELPLQCDTRHAATYEFLSAVRAAVLQVQRRAVCLLVQQACNLK